MPIPTPHKGEKQDDFMHRCMSNEVMKKEFPENKQRVAVCMSKWRKKSEKEESSNLHDDTVEHLINSFISRHPELLK